jgi:hypothetical protein
MDPTELLPPTESMSSLESRQKSEIESHKLSLKQQLKTCKKSEKAKIEVQMRQIEYDMIARHRDEQEALEEQIGMELYLIFEFY